MKKIRLLYTDRCDRNCEMCCNKKIDLTRLPAFEPKMAKEASEVSITGGEPLLYPIGVSYISLLIKENNYQSKVYVYTARTKMWNEHHLNLLKVVDGFTITIHDQQSADEFVETEKVLRAYSSNYSRLSMRLNVFEGITMDYPEGYIVKDGIQWMEDCPVPADEVFMSL